MRNVCLRGSKRVVEAPWYDVLGSVLLKSGPQQNSDCLVEENRVLFISEYKTPRYG